MHIGSSDISSPAFKPYISANGNRNLEPNRWAEDQSLFEQINGLFYIFKEHEPTIYWRCTIIVVQIISYHMAAYNVRSDMNW